jgi:hypothetical protein
MRMGDQMHTFRRTGVVALLSTLAFTLASCGDEDTDGARQSESQGPTDIESTQSPSPSPSPSASSFESERHSYSLELPEGWTVAEYGGTWTTFKQFSPGTEVPGEDVVSSPEAQGFLVANSMALPDGMSPADWLDELERLTRSGRDPDCDEIIDNDVLAGEPARLIEHRCEGMTLVGRSLTHGGRGYYFTIGVPEDDEPSAAALEGIVASIRFVDR